MDRFPKHVRMQILGCKAIDSVFGALPDEAELLEGALASGAHCSAARAVRMWVPGNMLPEWNSDARPPYRRRLSIASGLEFYYDSIVSLTSISLLFTSRWDRHGRREEVIIAGLRALGTVAETCSAPGRASVQDAVTRTGMRSFETTCEGAMIEKYRSLPSSGPGDGNEEKEEGAVGLSIGFADTYSRDDSRAIVQRVGAARITANALDLLRIVLCDAEPRSAEVDELRAKQVDDLAVLGEGCPELFARHWSEACRSSSLG